MTHYRSGWTSGFLCLQLLSALYGNNADLPSCARSDSSKCHPHAPRVRGVYDLLIHLISGTENDTASCAMTASAMFTLRHRCVVRLARWLLIGLRPVVRRRLDAWVAAYINAKLLHLVHESRLVAFIHLLRGTPRYATTRNAHLRSSCDGVWVLFCVALTQ